MENISLYGSALTMSTNLRCSNNSVYCADGGLTYFDRRLTMLPQSLAFMKALQSDYDSNDDDNENDTFLYSVSMTAGGHLSCGLSGRVEIWDKNDGKFPHSTNLDGHMSDMMQYGEHVCGEWVSDNQLTVVRYDRLLTNREEIVSILCQGNILSQIDVRYGNLLSLNITTN